MNNGKPKGRGRRVPKTANQTYPAITETKVNNTKDFQNWVEAGMPETWTPAPKPTSGPPKTLRTRAAKRLYS